MQAAALDWLITDARQVMPSHPPAERQAIAAVHLMMRAPKQGWRAPAYLPLQFRDLFLDVAEAAVEFDTEGSV